MINRLIGNLEIPLNWASLVVNIRSTRPTHRRWQEVKAPRADLQGVVCVIQEEEDAAALQARYNQPLKLQCALKRAGSGRH